MVAILSGENELTLTIEARCSVETIDSWYIIIMWSNNIKHKYIFIYCFNNCRHLSGTISIFPKINSAEQGLTHCGLVTQYGDINLGQHWISLWLVAWRHQAITWTNVDLSSVRSSCTHMSAILARDASAISHWNQLENYLSKILFKSPRGQWVNKQSFLTSDNTHINHIPRRSHNNPHKSKYITRIIPIHCHWDVYFW